MRTRTWSWLVPALMIAALAGACSNDDGNAEGAAPSSDASTPTSADVCDAEGGEEASGDGTDDEGTGDDAHEGETEGGGFSYDIAATNGPCHWSELDADWVACAGESQSPIDIQADDDAPGSAIPLSFDYSTSPLTIFNNGHTVQAAYGGNSTITLDGTTYRLVQFHFHAASEHTVNGEPAALEVHFVHYEVLPGEEGATTTTAQPDGTTPVRRLAVVGALVDVDPDGNANDAYAPIVANLPDEVLHDQAEIAAVDPIPELTIDAEAMLPTDRTFIHYDGSLTTPPCSEIVSWQVLTDRVTMSQDQIDAFVDQFGQHGNARPVQHLDGRAIDGAA